MMHVRRKTYLILLFILVNLFVPSIHVDAAEFGKQFTGIKLRVYAKSQFTHWEGVSSVSEFIDNEGQYGFAYVKNKSVVVCHTKNGTIIRKVKLKMPHALFGAVRCDEDGYYYLVTGINNKTNGTGRGKGQSVETVFLSKYDQSGTHIKTVGNDGSSSLEWNYGWDFNTAGPFEYGNCSVAMYDKYIAINYARTMYSGHQSNSVWMLDRGDLSTLKVPDKEGYFDYAYYDGDEYSLLSQTDKAANDGMVINFQSYNSHSLAQRAIEFNNGFLFISEGDAYPRAFSASYYDFISNATNEGDIFHFWYQLNWQEDSSLSPDDFWYLPNQNFAHMGNVCAIDEEHISFVATSVKSVNKKAYKEDEQLFVQIFDPKKKMNTASAYVTEGERTVMSGYAGFEEFTNYGVKWLTSYKKKRIENPQTVTDGKGNTIILYELFDKKKESYLGIYRIIIDNNGNITQKAKRISKTARLNPCEMPIYANGYIYWNGNYYGKYYEPKMYVFSYKV